LVKTMARRAVVFTNPILTPPHDNPVILK